MPINVEYLKNVHYKCFCCKGKRANDPDSGVGLTRVGGDYYCEACLSDIVRESKASRTSQTQQVST